MDLLTIILLLISKKIHLSARNHSSINLSTQRGSTLEIEYMCLATEAIPLILQKWTKMMLMGFLNTISSPTHGQIVTQTLLKWSRTQLYLKFVHQAYIFRQKRIENLQIKPNKANAKSKCLEQTKQASFWSSISLKSPSKNALFLHPSSSIRIRAYWGSVMTNTSLQVE